MWRRGDVSRARVCPCYFHLTTSPSKLARIFRKSALLHKYAVPFIASKSRSKYRANGRRVGCPLQNVVCAQYDNWSAKLRRTVKLVERSVITSTTPPRRLPPACLSLGRRERGFVSTVCNRPRIRGMSIHTASDWARRCHRSALLY